MPVYILVKAENGWDQDDLMVYQTGYPIDVRDRSRIGGKQVPPKFIQVEITDETDWQGIQNIYCGEWRREIAWEFIGHDYVIDGHRLKVFTKPEFISVSGLGGLTILQIEAYLNGWNGVIFSAGQNEVVFDMAVFDAIKSNGFWSTSTSLVIFDEKSYNQATGVHEVEANYGASSLAGLPDDVIEKRIIDRGGVVTRRPTNKITFEINRTSVLDVFKEDVKRSIDGIFARRRFKLLPSHIQMAIDNAGTLSVTRQQFAQYIYNRLDD